MGVLGLCSRPLRVCHSGCPSHTSGDEGAKSICQLARGGDLLIAGVPCRGEREHDVGIGSRHRDSAALFVVRGYVLAGHDGPDGIALQRFHSAHRSLGILKPLPRAVLGPEPLSRAVLVLEPLPRAVLGPEPLPRAVLVLEPLPRAVLGPEPLPRAVLVPELVSRVIKQCLRSPGVVQFFNHPPSNEAWETGDDGRWKIGMTS